jgi:methylated-DNA-protein-cysteine methyltransferase-like protein
MLAELLRTVRKIPKGKVSTYGGVAKAAGHEGAARQVVWALHNCGPDVPWQRVVGAGGKILLTGHHALEQRLRLEQEGIRFSGGKVAMDEFEHQWTKPKAQRPKTQGKKRKISAT